MKRRDTLLVLAASLAAPGVLTAQPSVLLPRVAILYPGAPESDQRPREAFTQGMRDRGYVEGRSFVLDEVFLGGRNDRQQATLAKVLRRKPAVIVVTGSHAVQAAKAATSSVPIMRFADAIRLAGTKIE